MNAVDPLPGEIGEHDKVLITSEPLRLEAPHLTGGCSTVVGRPAADNPTHGRVPRQPVGVVHVLVSGKATEHRLPQHPDQIMPTVPARASISQILPRDYHQAEHVIQLAI